MVSANMYLYDGKYYQDYSYEINIDELFENYKNVVKKLIHPAGYGMFSTYDQYKNIYSPVSIQKLLVEKNLFLVDSTKSKEVRWYTMSRYMTDVPLSVETISKLVTKKLSNSVSTSEKWTQNITKIQNDISVTSESISFSVTKIFGDTALTSFINVDGYYIHDYTAVLYNQTPDCSFT